jgi:hypothetical protein
VAALVCLLAAVQALAGERRRALRLLAAYGVAALAVAVLLYARFLPTLINEVLPQARDSGSAGDGDSGLVRPLLRLTTFYDAWLPLLAVAGLVSKGAPPHARRYVVAALGAGAALLGLRAAAPALFRDAKDVELLALPTAALAAVTLRRLWGAGAAGKLAAAAALAALLLWCVPKDAALYAARFVAVGR